MPRATSTPSINNGNLPDSPYDTHIELEARDKIIEEQRSEIEDLQRQIEEWRNSQANSFSPTQTDSTSGAIDYRRMYRVHRLVEFLNRARKILWDRMEPGTLKHGNGLFLGACPWELLAFHFRLMSDCEEKMTKRTVRRRGRKMLVPFKWFRFTTVLPDLGGRWSGKYYR